MADTFERLARIRCDVSGDIIMEETDRLGSEIGDAMEAPGDDQAFVVLDAVILNFLANLSGEDIVRMANEPGVIDRMVDTHRRYRAGSLREQRRKGA